MWRSKIILHKDDDGYWILLSERKQKNLSVKEIQMSSSGWRKEIIDKSTRNLDLVALMRYKYENNRIKLTGIPCTADDSGNYNDIIIRAEHIGPHGLIGDYLPNEKT